MDNILDILSDRGVLKAVAYGCAALTFACLTSTIPNVISNDGKGREWIMVFTLAFLLFVLAAAGLDSNRRMADVNRAKSMLDGRWARDGQPCKFAHTFGVRNDRRLIVTSDGFPFIYSLTELPDDKIHAVENRTGETVLFFREGEHNERLVKLGSDGKQRGFVSCTVH
jgi:hypothetical protein